MKDLSSTTLVIIPAFNAAEALQALLPDVTTYVCPDNLLVIDDGSTDTTREVLRNADVNYIAFRHNRGKGAALRAAYQYGMTQGYRSVLSLDADRQHDPECIPSFLAADSGQHLILGRRQFRASPMPLARRLSNSRRAQSRRMRRTRVAASRMVDDRAGSLARDGSAHRRQPVRLSAGPDRPDSATPSLGPLFRFGITTAVSGWPARLSNGRDPGANPPGRTRLRYQSSP